MILFKITYKEVKNIFKGISPNVLLTKLNIPWTMIDADLETIQEDIIRSLVIQKEDGILKYRGVSIDFDPTINLDKLITFYISDPQDSLRCLCCTVLSFVENIDELIKMMTRCAEMKVFL